MSANLGCNLGDLEHLAEALEYTEEAIRTLAPDFLLNPDAYRANMGQYVADYRRLAEQAGQDLDAELLAPILGVLNDLPSSS